MSTLLYLETFVDSTQNLPPDLQRQLNTIKSLDERCGDLAEQVQGAVGKLLGMEPQHARPDGPSDEYVELSRRVEADQRLLLQFSEEKVQVAQQVYDLLEMHAIELDKQIDDFEGDVRLTGLDGGMDFYSPGSYIPPLDTTMRGVDTTMRGRTPKLEDWGSLATTPAEIPVPLPPMPSIKRQASQAPVANKGAGNKRPRGDEQPDVVQAATPIPAPAPVVVATPVNTGGHTGRGGGNDMSGPGPKKRVKSTPQVQPTGSLMNSAGGSLGDADFDDTRGGVEMPAPPPLLGFINPPPPGLLPAAPRPQAPGKYLYQSGITEDLRGRHAELFWPPDSMWYLIEIQEVNVDTKLARIMYTTGEAEELDLDEIARDMHMSIISLQP
ncbi:hypothetical protein FOA52_003117 [Chlamydomonas sp. UWO 241]|nr:hypothetical protein FOA52_003117 [Chlamydomonas sp. UWO 241]